jgi:hypothetical protein
MVLDMITKLLTHVMVHHRSLLIGVLIHCKCVDVDRAVMELSQCVSMQVSSLGTPTAAERGAGVLGCIFRLQYRQIGWLMCHAFALLALSYATWILRGHGS